MKHHSEMSQLKLKKENLRLSYLIRETLLPFLYAPFGQ